VSSVYDCEHFVAVVAVSCLAVRHPLSLACRGYNFGYLVFELADLLDKGLAF
jgi:hypothetical protein